MHITGISTYQAPPQSPTTSSPPTEPFIEYTYSLLQSGASPKRHGSSWSRQSYDSFVEYCKLKTGAAYDIRRIEFAYFYLWFYFFEDVEMPQWRPGNETMHLKTRVWEKIDTAPNSPAASACGSERKFDILDAQRLCFEDETARREKVQVSREEIERMYECGRPPPIQSPRVCKDMEKEKRFEDRRDSGYAEGFACAEIMGFREDQDVFVADMESKIFGEDTTVAISNPLPLGHGLDTILETINKQFQAASATTASMAFEENPALPPSIDEQEAVASKTFEQETSLIVYGQNQEVDNLENSNDGADEDETDYEDSTTDDNSQDEEELYATSLSDLNTSFNSEKNE
ncbi:hypothetical protein GLAREA_11418 [Glarea lozoyensis ATCC 20868]|uniref:Uncharacterized protein n=1 Tax=Glarea lozoyensis (strain ATCC 20868 / MF5171) TaxID=1116229 RepID=S3CEE1_GLAL2|nr:uncharacterized protein GLAREA_11418 [Glarea lozoyensis ATCC 20868]EPE24837.1 hypothetical protein GLAREA_11418 [Glarea lozoyensis ATCC 20868]